MENIKKIKDKIKILSKIYKLTNAIYKIASAKFIKTKEEYFLYLKNKNKFHLILKNISFSSFLFSDYQKKNLSNQKKIYVLISSDRGLISDYNNTLFRFFEKNIKKNNKKDYLVLAIGIKAYEFVNNQKIKTINTKIIANNEISDLANHLLNTNLINLLIKKNYSLIFCYNEFDNKKEYENKLEYLFPLTTEKVKITKKVKFKLTFSSNILLKMLTYYLQNSIYGILLKAKLSEFSTRTSSMKKAEEKTLEELQKIKIKYQKLRKNNITKNSIFFTKKEESSL